MFSVTSCYHFILVIHFFVLCAVCTASLAQQSSLLQQNTCRDEEFCRQTTEETSRLEAELQSVRRLLQTHERSLEHDCVRTSAFREVCACVMM